MRRQIAERLNPRLAAALAVIAVLSVGGLASAAPGDPGEPIKLNGAMQPSGDVKFAQVSPDGRWVVYRADEEVPSALGALYSVPAAGGQRVRLSQRRVDFYAIDPTGSTVVYSERNAQRVYAIGIDGTNRRQLVDGRGPVVDFTSDGRSVLLQLGDDSVLVPVDGSGGAIVIPGARRPALSRDETMLVAVQRRAHQLVAQPVAGGDPAILTTDATAHRSIDAFIVSHDGSMVAYRLGRDELHVVSTAGGPSVRLDRERSWPSVIGPDLHFVDNGATVLFQSDQRVWGEHEIYAAPVDGSDLRSLTGPMVEGGRARDWQLSSDGLTVVYVADQDARRQRELYAVPVEGGPPVKLNGQLPLRGDVGPLSGDGFEISADSSTVIYRADQRTNNVNELWSVPIGGGTPIRLSGSMPPGGDVKLAPWIFGNGLEITADGTVVYVADQETNNVRELWSVPIGGGTSVKLNGPMTPKGDVLPPKAPVLLTTARGQVVYVADQDRNHRRELYIVDLPAD